MIEELIKIANAIDKAGISSMDWYSKLHDLPIPTPKKPCLRIWLAADGHIADIDSLSPELVKQLRKYEPNNGMSLPGFNVRPIYRLVISKDEIKKINKQIESDLKQGCFQWEPYTQQEDDFWKMTRDVLNKCFGSVREALENNCSGKLEEGETLQRFFLTVKKIDVNQFQDEYKNILQQKIDRGDLPISLILYFVNEEKKRKEDGDSKVAVPKFSIFLDIKDYEKFPVAHPETIKRLNELLMNNSNTVTAIFGTGEKDAYGFDAQHIEDTFPVVRLRSPLDNVILRSQAKTIPAQNRYHLCESKTFRVGAKSRERAKKALEWISADEREGETYGIAGDKELLFAYPCLLPQERIPFAKMIGTQKAESYRMEDKFERLSKSVIQQLKGLGGPINNVELEIFSLRKMDKARTKVVYYRNITLELLEAASDTWQKGCHNIPYLSLMDWSEKNENNKRHPVFIEFETVFPIKLHRYLNIVWKRDGDQTGKARVFRPTDGLRLLLEPPSEVMAKYMLSRFMQHAQAYFLALCCCTGRGRISNIPYKSFYPGILGLLLFKLNKHKEVFMKESAFLFGRFLRVADEIHRLYCEIVRKKPDGTPDFPPELCGSSFLASISESPVMALNQLCLRCAPYVKWARGGADKGDKGGLVLYWLKQWETIADQLHVLEWPKRLGPEGRAQVFLGYLASFPKKEGVNAVKAIDTTDEESSNDK
jgi:hypothetical protein